MLTAPTARAQTANGRAMPIQAVYVELGGNAGHVSINYDRRIASAITARLAFGMWRTLSVNSDQPPEFARLLAGLVNYLALDPTDHRSALEVGVGVVAGSSWQEGAPHRAVLNLTSVVGFRRTSAPILFRAGMMPQYTVRGDWPRSRFSLRIGMSLGLAF